jgi:hypothetical protein
MRRSCLFVIFLFTLAIPAVLAENKKDSQGSGWAIGAKAGTLGIGVDVSRSIVPRVLNLRVGAGFFSYKTDLNEEGIDYSAKLKLSTVPIALDVFPFKNWFRLGGGVVVNLNEIEGTGHSNTGTFTIGDRQYTSQDVGEINGKIKFNRASPYFGLGFNNPIKRSGRIGFFTDIGLLYHGTPVASLSTTKTIPGLQTEIDKEVQSINQDIKDFKLTPVIQFGLSIRF